MIIKILVKVAFVCVLLSVLVIDMVSYASTPDVPTWQISTAYKKGDVVLYSGNYYECLQDHNSISTWNPTSTPTLWKQTTAPTPTPEPTQEQTPPPIPTPVATSEPTPEPTQAQTPPPVPTPVATSEPTPEPTQEQTPPPIPTPVSTSTPEPEEPPRPFLTTPFNDYTVTEGFLLLFSFFGVVTALYLFVRRFI